VTVTTNAFTTINTPDLQHKVIEMRADMIQLQPTPATAAENIHRHHHHHHQTHMVAAACRSIKQYVSVSTAELILRCSCWRLSKIAAAAAAASSDRHQHQHHTRDQCRDKAAAAAEVDDGSGDAMMSTEMMTT
jgi:hypothetical protein